MHFESDLNLVSKNRANNNNNYYFRSRVKTKEELRLSLL